MPGMAGLKKLGPLLAVTSFMACAQTPPRFEAASVKPTDPSVPGRKIRFDMTPGRLTLLDVTLRICIQSAYNLPDYQLAPVDKWLETERFDIVATMGADEPPAAAGPALREQLMPRLRTLLEDRFQLKMRRERKTIPIYALVVAKGGFLLKEGVDIAGGTGLQLKGGLFRWTRRNARVSDIARGLSADLDRPVLDRTGIAGAYSFVLEWAAEPTAPEPGSNAAPAEAAGPSLFQAVQKQLGLRLEPTQGEVEIFTVDHVERPSGN